MAFSHLACLTGLLFLTLWCSSKCEAACPTPPTIQDLDWNAFSQGVWYQLAVSPIFQQAYERNCSCSLKLHTPRSPTTVEVLSSCQHGGLSGSLHQFHSLIVASPMSTSGSLRSTFKGLTQFNPYQIIQYETDPVVYTAYSCTPIAGPYIYQNLWIYSRSPTIDASLFQSIMAYAQNVTGFDVSTLVIISQSGCGPYYPFKPSASVSAL